MRKFSGTSKAGVLLISLSLLLFTATVSAAFTNHHWYKLDDNVANDDIIDSGAGLIELDWVLDASQVNRNTDLDSTVGLIDTNPRLAMNFVDDHHIYTRYLASVTRASFASVFSTNFAVSMWVRPTDGQPAASERLFGYIELDGAGGNIVDKVFASILVNGRLNLRYTVADNANEANAQTLDVIFNNGGGQTKHLVFVGFKDVTGSNGLAIWVNGVRQTLGVSDGDTSSINETLWGTWAGETTTTLGNSVGPNFGAMITIWPPGFDSPSLFYNGVIDDITTWTWDNADSSNIQTELIDVLFSDRLEDSAGGTRPRIRYSGGGDRR